MNHLKRALFSFITLMVITAILVIIYLLYGSTMININSENSINKKLAADSNSQVEILASKEYCGWAGVLYRESGDDLTHFVYLKKHKFYKNRFIICGEWKGNCIACETKNSNMLFLGKSVCFIFGNSEKNTKYSIFEFDNNTGKLCKKLDEIDVYENSFVLIKMYDMNNHSNNIFVFAGSCNMDEVNALYFKSK